MGIDHCVEPGQCLVCEEVKEVKTQGKGKAILYKYAAKGKYPYSLKYAVKKSSDIWLKPIIYWNKIWSKISMSY